MRHYLEECIATIWCHKPEWTNNYMLASKSPLLKHWCDAQIYKHLETFHKTTGRCDFSVNSVVCGFFFLIRCKRNNRIRGRQKISALPNSVYVYFPVNFLGRFTAKLPILLQILLLEISLHNLRNGRISRNSTDSHKIIFAPCN